MATTSTRQSSLFLAEDWQKIYTTFREADFRSYDYETIRKTMIDYLRVYYPEDFNDFIESSEYIAMIDMIAFLAQSLSFRADLNTRENILELAERRDSVVRLARMLSYNPKRNSVSQGLVKIESIRTTEEVFDSNGSNLRGIEVQWNDTTNPDFLEQFTTILNASLESAQRFGKPSLKKTINGVRIEEYGVNTVSGQVPVYKYASQVDARTMQFELVNGTFSGQDAIYEPAPVPNAGMNILYRNDNRGNASINTGFFLYFKQGELRATDFSIGEQIPNRVVSINVPNINQNDIWLYSIDSNGNPDEAWVKVPSVSGNNSIFNSISNSQRKLFAVNSRRNDQIDIVFGDGAFSDMPAGNFRLYYRIGNNLSYRITPEEMRGRTASLNYISRSGNVETLTVTFSLQYTVANASSSESLNDIRTNAPQRYYTQDRMVNGEDYNIYPITEFTNIIKAKTVNRTSSGISRFLDVKDVTGKFSSTNIYGQDGIIYTDETQGTFTFEWTVTNDILKVIRNQVNPVLDSEEMKHFYLRNFTPISLTTDITWTQLSTSTNASTGYFSDSDGNPEQLGTFTSTNLKYVKVSSLVKLTPPSGQYFDQNNNLKIGTPSLPGDKTFVWVTPSVIQGDGSNNGAGALEDGTGPVTLNEIIPSGAIVSQVIPVFTTSITTESDLTSRIQLYLDFGLRYDQDTETWKIIAGEDLNTTSDWNTDFTGDTSGSGLDASWLIMFRTDGETYTVTYRQTKYFFESVLETRFYFDPSLKIFDPNTGKTVKDQIKVLQGNSIPDGSAFLGTDYAMEIYGVQTESDGFVDNTKIKITFADSDEDGVIDNPDVFEIIVDSDVNATSKLVFFEKYTDAQNFERYRPIDTSTVSVVYTTQTDITNNLALHTVGDIFYATTDEKFFVITGTSANKAVTESTNYRARTGRRDLYFHYIHNAPNNRRIDPSPSNIHDMFILTDTFNTAYRQWISDTTGTIVEPTAPTSEELRLEFNSLDDVKMLSDTIIFNPAKFKPLFGTEAEANLQATFKVVKNAESLVTDQEVKSRMIEAINTYFAADNWDFGDTFYFSELSTFLHTELAPLIAGIVIVPKGESLGFGSLYQISSQSDELLISAATVDDIEIIDAITASRLQAQCTVVNSTG